MAWWNAIIAPVAGLFTKALDIVDDFVPDKDLLAAEELATYVDDDFHDHHSE
jgi:hypothetical protein